MATNGDGWDRQLSAEKVRAVLDLDDGFKYVVRVKAIPRLTDAQLAVVKLLAAEKSHEEIAKALGMSVRGVQFHVSRAALRIPGDGQAKERLKFWYRGVSKEQLTGEAPMKSPVGST